MSNNAVEAVMERLDRVLKAAKQHVVVRPDSVLTAVERAELAYEAFEEGVRALEDESYEEARRHLERAVDAGIEEARPLLDLCVDRPTVTAIGPVSEAVEVHGDDVAEVDDEQSVLIDRQPGEEYTDRDKTSNQVALLTSAAVVKHSIAIRWKPDSQLDKTPELKAEWDTTSPSQPTLVVSGPPGVGKSRLLDAVVDELMGQRQRVLIIANSMQTVSRIARDAIARRSRLYADGMHRKEGGQPAHRPDADVIAQSDAVALLRRLALAGDQDMPEFQQWLMRVYLDQSGAIRKGPEFAVAETLARSVAAGLVSRNEEYSVACHCDRLIHPWQEADHASRLTLTNSDPEPACVPQLTEQELQRMLDGLRSRA